MNRVLGGALGGLLLLVAGTTGCKRPKGSCDRRAGDDKTCTDVLASTIKDTSQAQCPDDPISHAKGTWSDTKCDPTGAIAGCEDNLSRTWYFPGSVASKVEHVAQMCGSGKLVDAAGKTLTGVTAEPIPEGAYKDRIFDEAFKPVGTKLEPTVAALEKIKLPAGAPSGTVKPSGGKVLGPANTAIVADTDLLYLTQSEYRHDAYPMPNGIDVRACGSALRNHKRVQVDENTIVGDERLKKALPWCTTLAYLVVVRSKVTAPGGGGGLSFDAGTVTGQVFVYELPSNTAIGGYSFKAQSSESVKSNEIEKDFTANYGKALQAGLRKASPKSTLVFEL